MSKRTTTRTAVTTNTKSVLFNEEQKLCWAHVEYTSSATAGNRQILLQLINEAGAVVFDSHAGATQAASLTYHYSFLQGIYRETSVVALSIQVPFPKDFVIPPGYTLKVFDQTNVDSADTFILSYQTETL